MIYNSSNSDGLSWITSSEKLINTQFKTENIPDSVSIRGNATAFDVSVKNCNTTEKSKTESAAFRGGEHLDFGYNYISEKISEFTNTFTIGTSAEGRLLYCIPIGNANKNAVFAAGFHGLEYLTSTALLSFAEDFYFMNEYHDKYKVYIIPIINPDGIDIAINGINPKNNSHQKLIDYTGIINFTKQWQSNSNGVDINHNFNANWESICDTPSFTKYGGRFPESEPETRSVVKFLNRVKPELFIAFHSQGKEIYYDFNGMENKKSKETAQAIADKCGYTAAIPKGTASFGGAKDWYIKEYHKQAFTVELGYGKNPLPYSELEKMKYDTKKICLTAIDETYM